jgi:hypothetical protein
MASDISVVMSIISVASKYPATAENTTLNDNPNFVNCLRSSITDKKL